ncbi:glycoside hydrolase family 16 protein [Multifurca ochricompacta]|uniref:Glycoside hydrolase family 16 protein n=1 Tax=Multifurca ochricompacta TaxID=376703 RepID=A0AAD4M959_9AGAM|nr:glycoside hydrolase family 16 protein [Multifurca ochricompacta]
MRLLVFAVISSVSLAIAFNTSESSLHSRHLRHAHNVQVHRRQFQQVDHYQGQDFMDERSWSYFSFPDPTGGQVNYLSHSDAAKAGMAYVQPDGIAVLAVDSKKDLPANAKRDSIRIASTKKYNGGLFIADFAAMPHGCAVWPAWWSVGPNWPDGGEIDVVEGVNNHATNQYTFHTGQQTGCSLTRNSHFVGNMLGTECKSSADNNAGCAFADSKPTSFGHGFNMIGGGVFAHLWDSTGIKIWHFERQSIPQDILSKKPDPSTWPTPVAFLTSTSCDISSHFHDHKLVLDITLCGGWASGDYPSSGCPGTCSDLVTKGANFTSAKWMINYIDVYH